MPSNRLEYNQKWYLKNKVHHNENCLRYHYENKEYHNAHMYLNQKVLQRDKWLTAQQKYNQKNPVKEIVVNGIRKTARENSPKYLEYVKGLEK